MSVKNRLFSKNEWKIFAASQRSRLEEEVSALDSDRLLNTSILDLSNYFAEKYKVNVPVLQRDNIVVDQHEAQIDMSGDRTRYMNERGRPFMVTGTVVEVAIPYEGEAACFETQPTTFTFSPPYGDVEGDALIFQIEGVDLTIDQVRGQIQQTLNDITQNLKFLRVDAERFNGNLNSYAYTLIAQRRKKVLTDRNLVSGLGYQLRERSEEQASQTLPQSRHKLGPTLPPAAITPYRPEPLLAPKDLTLILEIMQETLQLLSFSPTLLSTLSAEMLRSHLLVQLNARFEGKNAGELFAFENQSDLTIRVDGKAIFIAECVLWENEAKWTAALNRLLSKSSWRDAKAVIILFNHDNLFSEVLEVARARVKGHTHFKLELPPLSETLFPYILAQHGDRNRELLLTILTFETPSAAHF